MLTINYEEPLTGDVYTIRRGVSAQDNWDLIDDSLPDDIWFHLDDHPSPHVVIKKEHSMQIPYRCINKAAQICKEYSKLTNSRRVKVIYTQIKYVKKADTVGAVHIRKTKLVVV